MNLEVAKNEALFLMDEHGLLEKGWKFEFDSAKKRFGLCSYRKKIISLSASLTELNEFSRVKNTILHEIAHALTPKAKHGPVWVAMAKKIGCDGKRCYNSAEVKAVVGKFVAICAKCHKITYKFKKPRVEYSCGICSKKFDPNNILVYLPVEG